MLTQIGGRGHGHQPAGSGRLPRRTTRRPSPAALLKYAEDMVNRLNERAFRDALATANRFVDLGDGGPQPDSETATLAAYRDATRAASTPAETRPRR